MPSNLPTSRSYTLTAADDVPSELLNELQDAIIGAKHGDLTFAIPPSAALCVANCAYNVAGYVLSTGVSNMIFPLGMLRQGQRLKSVTVSLYGAGGGGGNATLNVEKITAAGVFSYLPIVSGNVVAAPAAAWNSYVLDLTDYMIAAGETLQFSVASNNNHRTGNVRVLVDNL